MWYDTIRQKIVNEVKKAKFDSILADEVTCHNKEIMTLFVRFMNSHQEIREE